MIQINIKPLSVNEAWQGKRFKTPKYKSYARDLTLLLPATIKLPPSPPYRINFEWGVSSPLADWDNPIKPTQDVICSKYGLNDKLIKVGKAEIVLVKKGQEYIKFEITEKY